MINMTNPEVEKRNAAAGNPGIWGSTGWMRTRAVKLRWAAGFAVVAAALMLAVPQAVGQHAPTPPPPSPAKTPYPAISNATPGNVSQEEQMRQARNVMRQKKLVEQVEKLQELTNELHADVAKTDKDVLSLDVIRKSEQVEKLAKSIHGLMVTQQQ